MHDFSLEAPLKTNIAYLRFRVDTLGEYFIYEEAQQLKKYLPTFLCGTIERLDQNINYSCCKEFIELYKPQWPAFPKSKKDIYVRGINAYKEFLKQQGIKLFHAQFFTDAVFYHQLIKECQLPLIVNLRGVDLFSFANQAYLPEVMPDVSKFVVKSHSMKSELTSLGCDPDKIEVIYGGINTDKIIFKPRVPNKENLKILSAGRFVDKKGTEITLKFFYRFLKICPGAELTLIGEGELKNYVHQLIMRMGIESKVKIKDYMPHPLFIKELYRHNLFILPSRTAKDGDQEGIPNVLKEAMASGMPVISTNHSGIPELIKDMETGYLVDENDHCGIAGKVQWILNNKADAFHACINARFYVEKKFNVKKTARQIERLYDDLLMPDYVRSSMDVNRGKLPKIFRVDLHLNKGCNSKCIMCDDWKNNITSSYSREDISRVLGQLQAFGVNQVRFHGQEPTLMKDLFAVMQEAKDKGFHVGLKTNALIFSSIDKVKKLDGILDDLYLSIDACDEKIHNMMRGNKQSFSRNMFLAESLRKINPKINIFINAVVSNANYKHLVGLLDLAQSKNIDRVSFVHLSTNNKDDIGHLKLSKAQLKEFYFQIWPQILKKSSDYDIPVSVDPYLYSLIGLPVNLQIKKLKQGYGKFEEEIDNFSNGLHGKTFYSHKTCYGVLDHATVDWEGNVFPCCAMPRSNETAIGNLHKDDYSTIWNSEKYVKYRKSILRGECRFKDQCSRSFKETVDLSHYFDKDKQNIESNGDFEPIRPESSDNDTLNQYNLQKLIYYSYAKSNIYQRKFKDLRVSNGRTDFSALPCVKRDELKYSFPKKDVVPNYFNEDYGIFRTSSCGSKSFLYARPIKSNIFGRMSASFMYTGMWKIGDPWLKLTSLNCLESQYPLKTTSTASQTRNHKMGAINIYASDNFLDEPRSEIKRIYDLILDSKARLIHCNPSHLKLLLYRFQMEGMPLKGQFAVHSTYETLLPSTRKLINKYLDCKIFNQYGCSEIGPISFRCRHGNNHIFSNTVHVELRPAHDLNRSDIGRVAVTHLKNYVMPFIKYLNGDIATIPEDKKCACGLNNPIMGDIVGREDEAINYKGKIVFPLELDSLFCDLENLLQYQVVYKNNQFILQLVSEDNSQPFPDNILREQFKHYFNDHELKVHVEQKAFILPKRKGKYSSVVSK